MLPNPISNRWHDIYHYNLLTALSAPGQELINHTFMVDNPLDRSIESTNRNFNEEFSELMFKWTMDGNIIVSDEMIAMNPNAKNYDTVFAPVGAPFNCTAYGPRIREQLPHVLDLLRLTAGSTRRANIMILGPQDIHAGIARERGETNCEYPCTLGFNFRVRNDKLDMITSMRSNNYTTTVNQDFFIFTLLQEHIAGELGIQVGNYYHSAQSAHVFESDVERACNILFEYVVKTPMRGDMGRHWKAVIEDNATAGDL